MFRLHNWHVSLAATLMVTYCTQAVIAQVTYEDDKLLAEDGASNDAFGISLALTQETIIIGAARDEDNGDFSGSAYLYDTATGQQTAKLLPIDGSENDYFGVSVSIYANTAIVGAFLDIDNHTSSGSAYLFDVTTGKQIRKLLPDDPITDAQFGISVGIYGNTAIVGARRDDAVNRDSGSAYIFDTNTGLQKFKLIPIAESAFHDFGHAVAISESTAIIGARYDDNEDENDSGSAYLFDTITGELIAKITADDRAVDDLFGQSVAINKGIAVIGAPGNDDNGEDSGAAYVFDSATGQQLSKLLPNDGSAGDGFGTSVAISGTIAVIGAPNDNDNGLKSGSAYLFDTTTGEQVAKLLPSDGFGRDFFAWSVAICDNTAIVGSLEDDDNGFQSGSAYIFRALCMPDLNNDGSLDFFDVSAFLTAYAANDPTADFNADGSFNFFDVSAFLVAYIAGCP
jgi:hypothetical protein